MSIHAGQRVRHWRELRNLSQLQLAGLANMDNTKLCRIESGSVKAKAEDIEQLAAAMKLSMSEFYGAVEEVA